MMRLLRLLPFLLLLFATPAHPADFDTRMVPIPGGGFLMGSPSGERGRFDSEGPQHKVTVKPFQLADRDVTVEQFLAFLRQSGYTPPPCDQRLMFGWRNQGQGRAYSPGMVGPPTEPAICLNWDDAQAYIKWLNARSPEAGYRLPTEAEWEYAARAGTTTARPWGAAIGKNNANCDGCGSQWDNHDIAPAASFPPNKWGLYDILGNVWQWTQDCWNENYVGAPTDGSAWLKGDCSFRVLRGGSWDNVPVFVRSASRSRSKQAGGDFDYANYAGFRLARSAQ